MLLELLWGLDKLHAKHLVWFPATMPCLSLSVSCLASSQSSSWRLCRGSHALWLYSASERYKQDTSNSRREELCSWSLMTSCCLSQLVRYTYPSSRPGMSSSRDELPVSSCGSTCCELSISRDGPWTLNICFQHHLFMAAPFISHYALFVPTAALAPQVGLDFLSLLTCLLHTCVSLETGL